MPLQSLRNGRSKQLKKTQTTMYINLATATLQPPYWLNKEVTVIGKHTEMPTQEQAIGNLYQCPLKLKLKSQTQSQFFTLPIDPVISISGNNKIIRTDVLKQDNSKNQRRGTIKEVWSQDDYTVQIAGILIAENENQMPEQAIRKLRNLCEARELIEVENDLCMLFNIKYIAIEKYEFAHTKGQQNQQFAITAYSDDDFSLFIK